MRPALIGWARPFLSAMGTRQCIAPPRCQVIDNTHADDHHHLIDTLSQPQVSPGCPPPQWILPLLTRICHLSKVAAFRRVLSRPLPLRPRVRPSSSATTMKMTLMKWETLIHACLIHSITQMILPNMATSRTIRVPSVHQGPPA